MKSLQSPAAEMGLTSWRPLNDYPHYKLSATFQESSTTQSKYSLWSLVPKLRAPPKPVIFRVSVSFHCNRLVCLHTDGSISLWSLPSLRLLKKWKLNEQPDYNARNPLTIPKFKKFPDGISEYHPMEIGWWSENVKYFPVNLLSGGTQNLEQPNVEQPIYRPKRIRCNTSLQSISHHSELYPFLYLPFDVNLFRKLCVLNFYSSLY